MRPSVPGRQGAICGADGSPTPTVDRSAMRGYVHAVFDAAGQAAVKAGVEGKIVALAINQDPSTDLPPRTSVRSYHLSARRRAEKELFQLATQPHTNVYLELVVKAADLPRGDRGREEDTLFVFGLGGDIDYDHGNNTDVGTLGVTPSFLLRSSSTPQPNHQPIFLFDAPVSVEAASIGAWALALLVGDVDANGRPGPTSQVGRIWRVLAGLNWPNRAKIARGRDKHPQPVLLVGGTGRPQPFDEFLAVTERCLNAAGTLGGKTLAEAYAAATGKSRDAPAAATTRSPVARTDRFSGNMVDVKRYLSATARLPVDTYDQLFFVMACWHAYFIGSQQGREIVRAVAKGDAAQGLPGPRDKSKYNDANFNRIWDALGKRGSAERQKAEAEALRLKRSKKLGIGSIVWVAHHRYGWDSKLTHWPGATKPGNVAAGDATRRDVQAVVDAGRDIVATGKIQATREIIIRRYAARSNSPAAIAVFTVLVTVFLNHQTGVCFPSLSTLTRAMRDETGRPWTRRQVSKLLRQIETDGYLVRSPGNVTFVVGGTAYRGPRIAPKPPAGETWASLLAQDVHLKRHRNLDDTGIQEIEGGQSDHHMEHMGGQKAGNSGGSEGHSEGPLRGSDWKSEGGSDPSVGHTLDFHTQTNSCSPRAAVSPSFRGGPLSANGQVSDYLAATAKHRQEMQDLTPWVVMGADAFIGEDLARILRAAHQGSEVLPAVVAQVPGEIAERMCRLTALGWSSERLGDRVRSLVSVARAGGKQSQQLAARKRKGLSPQQVDDAELLLTVSQGLWHSLDRSMEHHDKSGGISA